MPNKHISEDDQAFLKDVGQRLRLERLRQQLRQADIAALLGKGDRSGQQAIRLMEAGRQNIPLPTYLSWCDALGVEPWELIGWRNQ